MSDTVFYAILFPSLWIGLMILVGLAVVIAGLFKKGRQSFMNPKEYAEKMEAELNEKTPEKPIKKAFRNPFVLSQDEIDETKNNLSTDATRQK